ncbi:hypothetical protein ACN4EG_08105 [Alkalinema pantanalense CENA528]
MTEFNAASYGMSQVINLQPMPLFSSNSVILGARRLRLAVRLRHGRS